jgi:DNA primase
MEAVELPARFANVMVYADADEVGRRAAAILTNRLRAEGRNARMIVPKVGKDPNDVLLARRGRAAA